jgi:hypothetical protein
MKNIFLFSALVTCLLFSSCDVEDLINPEDPNITAKEKLPEVISEARTDFAVDSELASIYGYNVKTNGEINLQSIENAFVYVVQSDFHQANEFYVPVYNSSPIRSPINFTNILAFVKDTTAKNILDFAFEKLSNLSIDPSLTYDDSPAVLNELLPRSDVTSFRTLNPGSKIDMMLLPSKSIDTLSVVNSADWIVNFYSNQNSLVLWINTERDTVINLSEL